MAPIKAKWPKSKHNGQNPSKMASDTLILIKYGPFCLNLGHYALIKAILHKFWSYCLDLGPKGDEALRMGQGGTDGRTDGRTYGRTDRFPLCSKGLRPPQGLLPKNDTQNDISVSYFYSMRLPELRRG